MEPDVETVRHQVSAAETSRVGNQLIDGKPNRGVVRCDDGSGARADDDVNRNVVRDEPLQDADVRSTA
jgi:hypothetical protein